MGYFLKKLRTRISLMFDFLLKRVDEPWESVVEREPLRFSGLRRLSAWIAFITDNDGIFNLVLIFN